MDWKYLFTSFDGRINRKPYWIGALILVVAALVVQGIAYGVGGEALAIILSLVFLYPSFALNVKRAHDRDMPSLLVAIFFAILIVVDVMQLLGVGQTEEGPTTPYLLVTIPWSLFAIYMFVQLGCLRGTEGANQYGPDPLEGRG
jgi:uncharacterized membrane protein YhaH (DUF805 family)